ncbi:MAG: hypothetical protein AAFX87_22120 [Bacteroidota bacterium]
MKTTLVILILATVSTFCLAQDTLHVSSFPQPSEVRKIDSRADLKLSVLVAMHTQPDIIVYKDSREAPYMAVNTAYDFDAGKDDWIVWKLPLVEWDIEFASIDTFQIDQKGKPEIILQWRHDQAFGSGSLGGNHVKGMQIWNVDTQTLLLDMINYEDYSRQDDNTEAYYECHQQVALSNGGLLIKKVEGASCHAYQDTGYGTFQAFPEGFYLYLDGKWTKQPK